MTDISVNTSSSARSANEAPVTGEFQRLIIGGLGGTAPIIATLVAGEYENAADANTAYFVGMGLRALLFFGLGACLVWLNQAVRTRYAVFQLGIAAPALFSAMVHASPAGSADDKTSAASEVRLAYLASAGQSITMSDALPPDIFFEECSILDGLLGRKCGD